jgi:hypothetical protein
MRMPDNDQRQDCRVIPFVRPVASEDTILTSSIAAVIAVTILHREGESPEERLFDIIDESGEAEILDIADVMEGYETLNASPKSTTQPDNDNIVTKSL